MQEILANTKPSDIETLKPYLKYLMYKCVPADRPAVEMTYAEMHEDQPTWNVDSMIRGTKHLCEIAEKQQIMYDVYTQEECADDPEKEDVKLFFLPAAHTSAISADSESVGTSGKEKPFVILISGGAYTCVCSLVESFPTAARLNELGYNTFILNYRVLRDPLFPMPFQDIAAALRFILNNKAGFGITTNEYIVNGFSAGANLTSVWGSEKNGWKKYSLPRPKALWLIYPAISSDYLYEDGKDWFLSMMFGKDYDMETVRSYDIPDTFTPSYPPCYLVHAKDDPAVPYRNSVELKKLLDSHDIPAELELIEHGFHGWGDGSGTEAAGWPDRAAGFTESLA